MKFLNSQPEQRLNLPTNGEVYITNDVEFKNKCTAECIYVNSDHVLRLKENDVIFLDYGKIELVVKHVGKPYAGPGATPCSGPASLRCSSSSTYFVFCFFFLVFPPRYLRCAVSDKTRRAVEIS